jgi:hypothetical protein
MTGERQKKSSKTGISYLRTAELEKFANTLKSKKQYGGGHKPGHSSEISGVEESWDLVNNLLNNSAPVNLDPPCQVGQAGGKSKKKSYSLYGGGEESSGATFLPAQWNTPKAPLPKPNDPSKIESAYGKINAVSGMDVNLAAFPNSSMQQTGGGPKKNKKSKKSTTPKEKPAKKGKKTSKKEPSIWDKIKSFF